MLALACEKPPQAGREVCLHFAAMPDVRSTNPPEDVIDDVNIFIFGPGDTPEAHIWAKGREIKNNSVKVSLIRDVPYTFYICANTGYRMEDASAKELDEMRFFLTYPDEISRGIPMSATARDILADDEIGRAHV